jgi:DNA-binding transcriptional ArsR family regulator
MDPAALLALIPKAIEGLRELAGTSNKHQRARMEDAEKLLEDARKEITGLLAEKDRLKLFVEELQARLRVEATFEDHNGLLWKRKAAGIDPYPYCPKCKLVMSGVGRDVVTCSQCNLRAPFTQKAMADERPGAPTRKPAMPMQQVELLRALVGDMHVSVSMLSEKTKIDVPQAMYHLERLYKERKVIRMSESFGQNHLYSIEPEGLAFLVENNLL